jgi:Rps23 Pro-64 3,4-dihydroxylase Tpa1-like proline 4-hydroxylase
VSRIIEQHCPASLDRELIATKPDNGNLPSAWNQALYKVERGFMGGKWIDEMRRWLRRNLHRFKQGGDGKRRRNWEIANLLQCCPPAIELKSKLLDRHQGAMDRCKVNPFCADWVEMHAVVHHNRDQLQWHTDHFESSGWSRPETRTLAFCYYLRPNKDSFCGGQLEFWDGTRIEHAHDAIVWLNPYQAHRVRKVIANTDEFLDGRVSLIGWIHCRESECANNGN